MKGMKVRQGSLGYFKRRWYYSPKIGYRALDQHKTKLVENFLHWIKGEPQTDLNGDPLVYVQECADCGKRLTKEEAITNECYEPNGDVAHLCDTCLMLAATDIETEL